MKASVLFAAVLSLVIPCGAAFADDRPDCDEEFISTFNSYLDYAVNVTSLQSIMEMRVLTQALAGHFGPLVCKAMVQVPGKRAELKEIRFQSETLAWGDYLDDAIVATRNGRPLSSVKLDASSVLSAFMASRDPKLAYHGAWLYSSAPAPAAPAIAADVTDPKNAPAAPRSSSAPRQDHQAGAQSLL